MLGFVGLDGLKVRPRIRAFNFDESIIIHQPIGACAKSFDSRVGYKAHLRDFSIKTVKHIHLTGNLLQLISTPHGAVGISFFPCPSQTLADKFCHVVLAAGTVPRFSTRHDISQTSGLDLSVASGTPLR